MTPAWLEYAATFFVLVISGVIARISWTSAKDAKPEQRIEVMTSIEDQVSVSKLMQELNHSFEILLELQRDVVRHERRQVDIMIELSKDISRLSDEIKNMANGRK